MEEIPEELMNWDQTDMYYIPVGSSMMEKNRAKQLWLYL